MAVPVASLTELYSQHRDAVWNAAWHLLGDRELAEDVVHDVFVGLVARDLHGIARPRAYLLQAVVHRVRDRLRQRSKPGVAQAGELPADLPADQPSVQASLIAGEQRGEVAAALEALSSEQREVVVLHVFEELTFREIAELCQTSANTAASRWRYAVAQLSALLRPPHVLERE